MPATSARASTSTRSRAFDGLKEHALVRLTQAVEAGTGRLAEGAIGTIVSVWVPGTAFEVEFTEPRPALVTLNRDQIAPAPSGC